MTEEKAPLVIDTWEGGLLVENGAKDPRPEPDLKLDYNKWMESIEWCHIQSMGSAMSGFSFDVWAFKGERLWIMDVDAGGGEAYSVLVKGLANYLDIMAMMSPIATASILEGDTLASIFSMHRVAAEQHKAMQKIGEDITKRVGEALANGGVSRPPCDCEACIANRKDAAAKQAAAAN